MMFWLKLKRWVLGRNWARNQEFRLLQSAIVFRHLAFMTIDGETKTQLLEIADRFDDKRRWLSESVGGERPA